MSGAEADATTAGAHLAREIAEQPAALARLLAAEREPARALAAALRARGPFAFVLIAARGTSDNAARYAQYLFGAANRLPTALATPALFTLYDTPPDLRARSSSASPSRASRPISWR